MHRFIVGLYEQGLNQIAESQGPYALLPRDAMLFVGGLTGLLDVYGESLSEEPDVISKPVRPVDAAHADKVAKRLLRAPYRNLHLNVEGEDIAVLSALSPDRAGELLSAGFVPLLSLRLRKNISQRKGQ